MDNKNKEIIGTIIGLLGLGYWVYSNYWFIMLHLNYTKIKEQKAEVFYSKELDKSIAEKYLKEFAPVSSNGLSVRLDMENNEIKLSMVIKDQVLKNPTEEDKKELNELSKYIREETPKTITNGITVRVLGCDEKFESCRDI